MTLRDGCILFPTPSGSWALYGPGDEMVRVRAEPAHVARLAGILGGPVPPEEALAGEPEVRDLLERFAERGLLQPAGGGGTDGDLSGRRVEVRGAGPVAREVAALLARAGVGEIAAVSWDDPLAEADVIVACAGWLPDGRFRALDAWCSGRAIPWHCCYAEGDRFYLGPFALPGETARYEDFRARRLAASPWPRELEALWRHLEEGRTPSVPWPDAGGAAALAGALATDILAVLRGGSPPSAGEQTGFEPATFTWRRHPVLPVPRTLEEAP